MTLEQLHAYASEQDGMCKVYIDRKGDTRLAPEDQESTNNWTYWDYYHTDEPEHFDYERFDIERPEEYRL